MFINGQKVKVVNGAGRELLRGTISSGLLIYRKNGEGKWGYAIDTGVQRHIEGLVGTGQVFLVEANLIQALPCELCGK